MMKSVRVQKHRPGKGFYDEAVVCRKVFYVVHKLKYLLWLDAGIVLDFFESPWKIESLEMSICFCFHSLFKHFTQWSDFSKEKWSQQCIDSQGNPSLSLPLKYLYVMLLWKPHIVKQETMESFAFPDFYIKIHFFPGKKHACICCWGGDLGCFVFCIALTPPLPHRTVRTIWISPNRKSWAWRVDVMDC